jgi:glucosamine-6-phosphate deaminase
VIVNTFDTADVAAHAIAERLRDYVRSHPAAVLGLPTGRTPIPIYAELRRMHGARDVDLSGVTTFNLDEFAGLQATDPGSFHAFMQQHLFAAAGIHPSRTHFLNGAAADLAAECGRYEAAIAAAGGIDVQLLGIGANGHIGFNEPADEQVARTHVVTLQPSTRRDNAALFDGDADRVPPQALTMGIGTIPGARQILLAASGERKARCIERLMNGGVTPQLPASFLQLHSRVELFLDRAAASLLA